MSVRSATRSRGNVVHLPVIVGAEIMPTMRTGSEKRQYSEKNRR